MDKDIRNLIQRAAQDARRLLEREFREQLEGRYDVLPETGGIAEAPGEHLDAQGQFTRARIVAAISHERTKTRSAFEAIDAYLREAAFTTLNRFAALKLMEARRIVQECVSKGEHSAGFREFSGLAPGLGDLPDRGYRLYLECLFDEIGVEVGALFDRRHPSGLLWPRRPALLELLDVLNRPGLAAVWAQDETIGWFYQYFNSKEERDAMRDTNKGGAAAPRNSRELAVRNQFFTPRYVVEFLADNTLGRLWCEMRGGQTALKEQCRYMVRRPDEVYFRQPWSEECGEAQRWLETGEGPIPSFPLLGSTVNCYAMSGEPGEALAGWVDERLDLLHSGGVEAAHKFHVAEILTMLGCIVQKDRFCEGTIDTLRKEIDWLMAALRARVEGARKPDMVQQELLRQPVFIPWRPLKDPREIRMLDPACGSMHFGLYAFDLFEAIYSEAWDYACEIGPGIVPFGLEAFGPFLEFAASFSNKDDYLKEVPRLILEHNIHGIDIDPRAAQIAGFALWLRAQRAWGELKLPASARPHIRKSNVVCAEPMAGGPEDIHDFVDSAFAARREKPVFQLLLVKIQEAMKLAGEAGSLLKIEDDILAIIAEAKKLATEGPVLKQTDFLAPASVPAIQGEMPLDLSGVTDDEFWDRAEHELLEALSAYSESVTKDLPSRLFAQDAARGIGFIHLCREKYDVALMNPPFGDASLPSKSYIDETYGDTKGDVYKAFVECFQTRLIPGGYLGIISSRTGFFLGQSEDWRTRVVLRLFRPIALADLGSGVLDAMVEVAAYVLRSLSVNEARDLTLSLVPILENVLRDKKEHFSLPKWQAARDGLKRHQAVSELEHLEKEGFIRRYPGDVIRYTPLWPSITGVVVRAKPVSPLLARIFHSGSVNIENYSR